VLHDAVTAAADAPMGPQLPMISSVPAAAMEKVKEVVNRLKEADRSAGEAALAAANSVSAAAAPAQFALAISVTQWI
jgi:hypothetical protein